MENGARVKVVKGRKVPIGTLATVFWVGDNQWGEGKRLGLEADDGETYWTAASNVEASREPPVEIEPPDKGVRVCFEAEGAQHLGEVFWVGPSKSGRGWRVGVTCTDGETRWTNARAVQLAPELDAEAPF